MFDSKFQLGAYLAPAGWFPKNIDEDYLVTYLDIEIDKSFSKHDFEEIVATCAAQSSTGIWKDIEVKKLSGLKMANKMKAIAFDLNFENRTFKIAYKTEIFELGNMSGILTTVVGNLWKLEKVNGVRCLDIRFPKKILNSFPGPQFGVYGVRERLLQEEGPLFVTVPIPKIGMTAKEQASLAKSLFTSAKGEYHGIQDDENLTDLSFNTFDQRCELINRAREDIEQKTGRKKVYICNITHSNLDIMIKRADRIKSYGGMWMMIDSVTTGFGMIHSLRLMNPGLALHASRGMNSIFSTEFGHDAYDKGEVKIFSISAVVNAKIHRLLGVDSFESGFVKSQDGESKLIRDALQLDVTAESSVTLGQNWFGMKPVWYLASNVPNPGVLPSLLNHLGEDIIIQTSQGVLGHPWGVEAGAEAMVQAKDVALGRGGIQNWIQENPESALAKAASFWNFNTETI
ncbi:MAG: RuBisCO large subunit C-terminal-like domain-containing protein [Candidatus Dojkabacteria bacterium]